MFYTQFSWWLSGKESACQCRKPRFYPQVWKITGKGNGNPLLYSCLGNPMDKGAWEATVPGVIKSCTQLTTHAHTCTNTHTRIKFQRLFTPKPKLFSLSYPKLAASPLRLLITINIYQYPCNLLACFPTSDLFKQTI